MTNAIMQETDGELVERVLAGETERFRTLVQRYQDAVYGVALSRTGSFADAEDVAQDAFLSAFESLDELDNPESFGAWLYRIAANRAKQRVREDRRRQKRHDAIASSRQERPTPDELASQKEVRSQVMAALQRLSETNRETATLYYINAYSTADISRLTGRPVGTVRRRLHDARKKLRKELVAMVEDELKQFRPGKEFADEILRKIRKMRVWTSARRLFFTDDRNRSFWVHVGPFVVRTIEPWLAGKGSLDDQDIFTTAVRALKACGCEIKRAVMDAATGQPLGLLTIKRGTGAIDMDCPPGTAINLAVRQGAPVLIEDTIAEERSIKRRQGGALSPAAAWDRARHQFERDRKRKPFADVSAVLRALEKSPASDEARIALAACAAEGITFKPRRVKDVSGAEEKLREWVEKCKGTKLEAVAAGLVGAAYLYTRRKPEEAIPYLAAAQRAQPLDKEIAFDLATAYTMADMTDEALQVLEKSEDWGSGITRPHACGNFRKLWDDRRFRAIVGEPDPRCERLFCQAQLRILAATGPPPVPRDVGPYGEERMQTPEAPEELASQLEELSGCGPLLSIRSVHRISKWPDEADWRLRVAKARQHAVLEVTGNRAAAIGVPKNARELLDGGFRPFPDFQPKVPLAVYRVLEGAGITLKSVVLLKRSRRGIEGALIISCGKRQEAIAIAGVHGLALAMAAERPMLITESLAEKLYLRGKTGKPLSPKTARKRLVRE